MTTPENRPRVVVGIDGSESSQAALRWAARIAAGIDADIEAVIAWDYPPAYGWPIAIDANLEAEAAKVLEAVLDDVFGHQRPTRLSSTVRRGHARDVLLDESRDAEVLVVGSRGHGGFAGLLLGSVSAACAEHARCAVLVTHGNPPRIAA